MTKQKRDSDLIKIMEKQPYHLIMNEIKMIISKDVFPPEFGFTSKHLGKILSKYQPETALDMGCGSGYLSFILKRNGVKSVYGADIHLEAINCADKNAKLNNMQISFFKSDLFENVPKVKFDLIVFNQPYYPIDNIFGCSYDGGKVIIERFLSQAKEYLSNCGKIIMPFTNLAGEENNPKNIGKSLDYKIKEIVKVNEGGYTHQIYEFAL